MKISSIRIQEGKTAKLIVLGSVIIILSAVSLMGEAPVYAEVADATATWSDVPPSASPIGSAEVLPDTDSTSTPVSTSTTGKASWYVHPRYRSELMAASTVYPKGTKIKVTNLQNNKSVIVTIKDYGPDPIRHPERVIDLNKPAFARIASIRAGVINVSVEEIIGNK